MALIAEGHPAISGDSSQYWTDELENSRILLFELDKAILALSKKEIRQYSINTGQDQQSVTRLDLPQLYDRRAALIQQIDDLENMLGLKEPEQKIWQVVPI
jgi:hypothetical protein